MTGTEIGMPAEQQWRLVDEGWGRKAVEFATLGEPGNTREYVAMHHRLDLKEGQRLLDVACGAGLALELAGVRGARCAGIDASERLLAVARDRNPDADLRLGDMNALPWEDESFDVVTSFRGIWGTTPDAVAEAYRVLRVGGHVGLTVWGHIKASPGAWALAPLMLAAEPKVQNQAAMVALGRPGAGEALLSECGFTEIERVEVPFVWEFADPEAYARALASTGPAFEAIQEVGEEAFLSSAIEVGEQRVREGLPLRAPIAVVGYIASKPGRVLITDGTVDARSDTRRPAGFLLAAADTPEVRQLFEDELTGAGYVANWVRVWAHLPAAQPLLAGLMEEVTRAASLTYLQRAVLVTSAASTLGDSYCSLAWGKKLAEVTSADVVASVIGGSDDGLDAAERALARWARLVATDPNAITPDDVQALREAGFEDQQIFAITTYVAFRLAFSTVNDALGASPDSELSASVPERVRAAIRFGRTEMKRGPTAGDEPAALVQGANQ
jgi:SAM-dependent methyltransferase/alkylhydroperoxidase family enzyme